MFKVMTVCTGNICRSPMAQVVLSQRFEEAGLAEQVAVSSRGTSDEERGNPIDHRAQQVLAAAGYRVPRHRATRVTSAELAEQDLVLAMTYGHYRVLQRLAGPDDDGTLAMYRSFDPALAGRQPGPDLDLDDPWYGGFPEFEDALAEIEAAAPGIVARIERLG